MIYYYIIYAIFLLYVKLQCNMKIAWNLGNSQVGDVQNIIRSEN